MDQQIVLMTGSSSGIGLANAQRLARDPAQRYLLIATVIALSEKDDLVAAIGDALEKTVFIRVLDITNDDNIEKVVDDVIKSYGRIDILMNIAGLPCLGIPERISREQINKVFNVNVIGTIRLTQAVLPYMKERKAGKIVAVTSIGGRQGRSYLDFYCSTRFALEGFFESLAASLRSFNIRVCLIEPGAVNTGLLQTIINDLQALIDDDSINDIDRQHLATMLEAYKRRPTASVNDIAHAMVTRCLEVDDPVFRHLLEKESTREALGKGTADLTGEVAIANIRRFLGF